MVLPILVVCLVMFVVLPFIGATVTTLISTLVFGLVIGALGRLVAPGRTRGGCLFTSLIGIFGSLIGSYVARALHVHTIGTFLLEVVASAALVLVLTPQRRLGGSRL